MDGDENNFDNVERNYQIRGGQEVDDDDSSDSDSHCSSESSRNFVRSRPISTSNIALHAHQQRQQQLEQQNADLETAFSINAMHYHHNFLSETQRARSDAATVCSGSILEDIEVESVISQEDNESSSNLQQNQQHQQQHQDDATGIFDDEYQNQSSMTIHQKVDARSELSENDFGFEMNGQIQRGHRYLDSIDEARSRAFPAHFDKAYDTFETDQAPPVFSSSLSSIALLLASENHSYGMGPPLSRSLLLDRGLSHHHHGSDSGSLQEYETRSNVSSSCNQDYEAIQPSYKGNEDFDETAVEKVVRLRLHDSHSQSGSVKSYGSFNTGGDTDDCGGSLDVETHSIEAKSIHSQDDVAMLVTDNPISTPNATMHNTTSVPAVARSDENVEDDVNCRSSPNERHEGQETDGDTSLVTKKIMRQEFKQHETSSANNDVSSMNDSHFQWNFMRQTGHDYDHRRSYDDIMNSRWDKVTNTQDHSGVLDAVPANDGVVADDSYHQSKSHRRGRRSGKSKLDNDEERERKRERSRSRDREDEKMPSR